MENKNQKQNISGSGVSNIKNEFLSPLIDKTYNNNQIKKKVKCPQLLGKKSNNKLPQVNPVKNKTKIDSKTHSQNNFNGEEIDNNNNIKDILNEISEISADLELFEMEKRKRKMMKLI